MFNIWTILKSCGIAFLAASIIFYIRLFQLKLKLGGVFVPFHLPFIGIAYKLFIERFDILFAKSFERTPSIVKIMNMNFYLTSDLDEIKVIMNHPDCLNKSEGYLLGDLLNNSLLLLPTEKWKPRRKILTKCFNPKILNSFLPTFQEKTSVLVEIIKTQKGMNIFKMFEHFTYDSFCATTLGTKKHLQIEDDCQILPIISELQELLVLKFINPLFHINFIFSLFGKGKRCADLQEKLYQLIKDDVNFLTILDVLLELEEEGQINEKSVIDEMILVIEASTDTTGSTLAFACGMLGMHRDIQEKLYQEVIEAVGPEGEVHADQIPLLRYTEMVLNETMRLFPAGNRILPEGINIFVPTFLIHRSKEYYKDPLKFDPLRFSLEEITKRPSCSYLPFSYGPRNCIGMRYAMLIMKIAMVEIIRNFKIETKQKSIEEIILIPTLVTRSDNLECSFIPRQK